MCIAFPLRGGRPYHIREPEGQDLARTLPGLLRWLRLRARSEVRGDNLSDLLRELGIPRSTFYPRTTALALRVVAYLNARLE